MKRKGKITILFVCLGNICRSPAAEAIMKNKLQQHPWLIPDDFVVDSAGIGGWHEGQLPDHRMRSHGRQHGYDISSIARQIKYADFSRFDYIFGMDSENVADLESLAHNADDRKKILCAAAFMTRHPEYSTVPDPYYGNGQAFELALDLIEDACDGIIKWMEEKHAEAMA